MLIPVLSVIILYFQASYARSIDATVTLDQLIKTSEKQNRPVIIIMNSQKNLGLPDFSNEQEVYMKKQLGQKHDRRQGIEDCKHLLRQRIENKCNNEANCTKVIWKVAEGICEGEEE